ncbi:MAG: hypothetical protein FWC41_06810 [Firmicutes bacterium]|nr:hypothetical protein [Bacillota bacterium]
MNSENNMENSLYPMQEQEIKLQLHLRYVFADVELNSIDAFKHNTLEKHFLNYLHTINKSLNNDVKVNLVARKEGSWENVIELTFKFITDNNILIGVLSAPFILFKLFLKKFFDYKFPDAKHPAEIIKMIEEVMSNSIFTEEQKKVLVELYLETITVSNKKIKEIMSKYYNTATDYDAIKQIGLTGYVDNQIEINENVTSDYFKNFINGKEPVVLEEENEQYNDVILQLSIKGFGKKTNIEGIIDAIPKKQLPVVFPENVKDQILQSQDNLFKKKYSANIIHNKKDKCYYITKLVELQEITLFKM